MSNQAVPVITAPQVGTSMCFNEEKIRALRARLPDRRALAARTEALKAVANPGRLAVLRLVALEECCVCDVAYTLEIPVSTASRHLQRLRRAGVLRARQDGKFVYYTPADGPVVASLLAATEVES